MGVYVFHSNLPSLIIIAASWHQQLFNFSSLGHQQSINGLRCSPLICAVYFVRESIASLLLNGAAMEKFPHRQSIMGEP